VCENARLEEVGLPRATSAARRVTPGWEAMRVVACRECGAYAVDPMPRWDAAALQELYGAEYFGEPPAAWQRFRERLDPDRRLDEIAAALGPTGAPVRFLDVGCGPGFVLDRALRRGWTVAGVEPSRVWAERTAARLGVPVHATSVEACDLPAASCDVVFADSVIEHLTRPLAMLRLAARVLRDGGLLYLVTPNAECAVNHLRQRLFRAVGSRRAAFVEPLGPPYHLVGLTRRSLATLAARGGFEIRRCRVYGGHEELLKQADWLSLGGLKQAALLPGLLVGEACGMGTTVEALLTKRGSGPGPAADCA
jgi:SAM-dependent methyltransferase